jgi:hypothetical protein
MQSQNTCRHWKHIFDSNNAVYLTVMCKKLYINNSKKRYLSQFLEQNSEHDHCINSSVPNRTDQQLLASKPQNCWLMSTFATSRFNWNVSVWKRINSPSVYHRSELTWQLFGILTLLNIWLQGQNWLFWRLKNRSNPFTMKSGNFENFALFGEITYDSVYPVELTFCGSVIS